jgi:hypothetical protein
MSSRRVGIVDMVPRAALWLAYYAGLAPAAIVARWLRFIRPAPKGWQEPGD